MKLPQRRQFLHLVAGAAALPAVSRIARAQTYPSRPITIVIGYAAGGPTDTRVRILAQHMRGTLGQSVIVENMTGASGSLGIARVGRAAADEEGGDDAGDIGCAQRGEGDGGGLEGAAAGGGVA